jgi:hypothetical protein
VNEEIIRSEADLVGTLRTVLDKSIFRVVHNEQVSSAHRSDLTVKVECDGRSATFAAACRLNVSVAALAQVAACAGRGKHPLLVTVRLSESLVGQCRERGISCLDLNGRVWIKAPGLLIDRNVPNSFVRYRPVEAAIRFFSPKSTRLARVLLHSPGRTWRQSDLAVATGLSQGLLSRLLNHAVHHGWVEGSRGDWKLVNADALLDAWEQADDFSRRATLRQYSTLESDRRIIARLLVERTHGKLAFSQWFAADLRCPYADVNVVTAYRWNFPSDEELHALSYREVEAGGKIWILVPHDEGVFQNIQQVEGLPLVSDAQIYIDLIHAGFRGPDQAKALRQWKGFCRP